MAIDVAGTGHTLLWYALAQNDVDMQGYKLLHLDTSNLTGFAAPPTINPPPHQWLRSWDNPSHTWGASQPNFTDLAGHLTTGPDGQQRVITELGIIGVGTWRASVIAGDYLTTLNLIRPPLTDVSMANHKLTNLADPVNPGDAVNLRHMDSLLEGLNPKAAVRLASTTSGVNLVGLQVVDGVMCAAGDRILVKNRQTEQNKIGIYKVGPSPNYIWTRSTDCNHTDPAHPETDLNRAYCVVLEGGQAGTSWVQSNHCVNPDPDYVFEPKNFVQFSSASGIGPPGPPGAGVPADGSAGQILSKIDDTPYNTKWINPSGGLGGNPNYSALQTAASGNLAAIPHTVDVGGHDIGLLEGQAYYITPQTSGKVVVTIAGFMWNDSPAGQVSLRMCLGSGTAPAHGAPPPVGTSVLVGAAVAAFEGSVGHAVPFSVTSVVTTLTAGIRFWYDLLVTANTTGNAILSGVSCSAFEIP